MFVVADDAGNGETDIALADTAVTPGSYTNASITVDQKGRITAASSGAASGAGASGILWGYAGGATVASGTTTYLIPDQTAFTAGGDTLRPPVPFAVVRANVCVYISTDQPAQNLDVALQANGVDTALVFTLTAANTTGQWCSTTTDVTIAAGALVRWRFTQSAGAASAAVRSVTSLILGDGAGGGAGGAPTNARYWVGAADGSLSAEHVVPDGVVKSSGGVPSAAARADILGLWTSCLSGYLKADGTCDTPAAGAATVTTSGGVIGDGSAGDPVRLNAGTQRTISASGSSTITLNVADNACQSVTLTVTGAAAGDKASADFVAPSEVAFVFVEGVHVRPGVVDVRICNRSGGSVNQPSTVVSAWTWGPL